MNTPGAADPPPIYKYFAFDHLRPPLRETSKSFHELATLLLQKHDPDEPEVRAGLRKLLEAKDCFVRAALDNPGEHPAQTAPSRDD